MVGGLQTRRGNVRQVNHAARAVHDFQRLAQIGQIGTQGVFQGAGKVAVWPGNGQGVHGDDLMAAFEQVPEGRLTRPACRAGQDHRTRWRSYHA